MPIVTATYYARAAIARDPDLASNRSKHVLVDANKMGRVFKASKGRYGARKAGHQLRRELHDIARCTLERLMQMFGLQGVTRGKTRTTIPDPAQPCPDDKVNREVSATVPNQLWISDFTDFSSLVGMIYVAFVIDVFAPKKTRVIVYQHR